MLICLHYNPSQKHQVEHGQWFRDCFINSEHKFVASPFIEHKADVHIVSGPHWAKQYWLEQNHPRVIWLDRAYLPNHQIRSGRWKSEDYVSLGWMNSEGGRDFVTGRRYRPRPEIKDNASGEKTIFLADFDGPIEPADTVRLHPAQATSDKSLLDSLHEHRTAIGYNTTALVTAALEGLDIICKSSQNIMSQENWIDLLPYADWHYSEIQKGTAWEHLEHSLSQLLQQKSQ